MAEPEEEPADWSTESRRLAVKDAASRLDRAAALLELRLAGVNSRPRRDARIISEYLRGQADLPEADALRLEYRRAWADLYTEEFLEQVERLREGDASGVEAAIAYLEADPWHFRSGYLKQTLARHVRRVPLTERQADRLREAILNAWRKGPREDLKEYIRLAKALDSPPFREKLRELSNDLDPGTGLRAERALVAMNARRADA